MRFRIDAKVLRAATQQGLRTRSSRNTVAVLGCFHLEATKSKLVVSSTDMSVAGRITVDNVDVLDPGKVLVPATRFDKIVSTFDGELVVEIAKDKALDGQVVVSQGDVKITSLPMPLEDYPTIPRPTGDERQVVVLAPAFRHAFDFVYPHASKDESRPVLTGVLFEPTEEKLVLAATDSYRMAVTFADSAHADKALGDDPPIIPGKALAEVRRLLKNDLDYVEVRRHDQYVTFEVGNVEFTARVIDGQYPNWRQLRPENFDHVTTIDREAFVKSLTRIDKLTGKNAPMRAKFFEDPLNLHLSVNEQDVGEIRDKVPVFKTTADERDSVMEIGWNAELLLDCAKSFNTPDISIGTINPLRPTVLYNEPDGEFTMIMPIRLAG